MTRSRWSQWLRIVFGWVAVAGMALATWDFLDFLVQALAGVRPSAVGVAILPWSMVPFVSARFAVIVLGRTRPIDYRTAFSVHALRLPAKYLPGGIWHMVGRVVDFG